MLLQRQFRTRVQFPPPPLKGKKMTQYKIVYKVNGIEFFRNISYASSAFEAGKMTELSAKWNDKDCDFQIISVEEVDTESKNKSSLFQYGDSEL
tara:strand:- start:1572 stop:1853 length:282 start_codon:yes stop_codon:yes gene_type:complete